MLALSRKVGQRIVIDGGIEVEVVRIKGGRVVLAVSAPRDVRIMRDELLTVEENAKRGRQSAA